jgi:hypothetical protein
MDVEHVLDFACALIKQTLVANQGIGCLMMVLFFSLTPLCLGGHILTIS